MHKKPTMKDVASKAQVSTATVARVIHGRGFVSKVSRQKVEKAIEQTGYRINILAQSLRRQRTKTIGHLLTSISPNPFFAGVELGVEHEALKNGYSVLIWNVFEEPERERRGVETFIQRQVDAMIFTTPIEAQNVQLALDANIPVVQVERPTKIQTHAVLVDNYTGSKLAIEHLIELGHRRIAFIGGNPRAYRTNPIVDEQRLAGYRDTLMQHGITPRDEWIVLGKYYSLEDGFHTMERFVAEGNITAVFTACDILAAGALQAIYEKKLRVPEDISVVGFDNTYASYLSPPLTTVEQPMFEIGQTAAKIAIDALNKQDDQNDDLQVECLLTRLKIRNSTFAPHDKS